MIRLIIIVINYYRYFGKNTPRGKSAVFEGAGGGGGGLNLSLVFWWKSPKRPKFNNVLVKKLHQKSSTVKFEDFLIFAIIAISSSFWCFPPQKAEGRIDFHCPKYPSLMGIFFRF